VTTRERIDLLAGAYPRLFPRAGLIRLMRAQLGGVDVLDGWVKRDGVRVRAKAPRSIYHICAGNLAVSAWTSLAHGLLLGSENTMKLPGDREDATTRREIVGFIQGLPSNLRALVTTEREIQAETLGRAEAVIAFGSDATMESLQARVRWDQKFIGHGHALSLLWIGAPERLTSREARACARDVLTYDQLGCLSPQAIYVPKGTEIESLGKKLAVALEAEWRSLARKPGRPLGVAARIAEARDLAHALGHRVWLPDSRHLGWTLIGDPDATFAPSPLHGVITVRRVAESGMAAALAEVAGRISTVGVAGEMSSRLEEVFLRLGVTRFCRAGHMQAPPLTWHHDGRAVLSDLATWVDAE